METWAGSRGHPPRLWGEAGAFGPLPASQPQSSVFLLNSLDVTLHILSINHSLVSLRIVKCHEPAEVPVEGQSLPSIILCQAPQWPLLAVCRPVPLQLH